MPDRGNPSRPPPRALAPKVSVHSPGMGVMLVGSTVAGSRAAETTATTQQRSHGGNLEQHTPPLAHHHQITQFQQHLPPSSHQQQHHQLHHHHHHHHHQPHPGLHDIKPYPHNNHSPQTRSPSLLHSATSNSQASASSSTGGYVWATDTSSNSQTPQPQSLVMDIPKMKRNCVSNACVHCRKKRSKVGSLSLLVFPFSVSLSLRPCRRRSSVCCGTRRKPFFPPLFISFSWLPYVFFDSPPFAGSELQHA
ncbi:hypothetical protein BJ508DRAFT_145508 [Ascobolus immersus RN42]|uniref:Uncharacterized protein n=1 Tax=Ascobolus immersus RN42 TaxID=1160509 RepID=A0A3N4I118_ASCIM|nr:hypothetical protein BJ508DRAFT_145508 [Ascobolus immersus RN42]